MSLATTKLAARGYRPPYPILNEDTELAEGLLSMVAAPRPQDLVQGLSMTGTLTQRGVGGVSGPGFQFTNANDGVRCTVNQPLKFAWPITIAAHFLFAATPSASSNIFGVNFNSTESDPFISSALVIEGSGFWAIQGNTGGTFFSVGNSNGLQPTTNILYSYICTFASGSQQMYLNGEQIDFGHTAINGTPTFGTGPILAAGEYITTGRNTNLVFLDGMIWNRILGDGERAKLNTGNTWELYRQPSNRAYAFMSSAAAFDATQFPHIPLDNPYIVPTRMVPSGRVS